MDIELLSSRRSAFGTCQELVNGLMFYNLINIHHKNRQELTISTKYLTGLVQEGLLVIQAATNVHIKTSRRHYAVQISSCSVS